MVRTVIGDETHVERFVESLFQSGISLQVGVAIGKLGVGSNRDVIFALVPTPPSDRNEVVSFLGQSVEQSISKDADRRKGSKGKSTSNARPLQIDADWVGEHGRQVSKMLVGGMSVVGIYIFASENSFKSSMATLWQTLRTVATAASASQDRELDQERLLLHISYSPRRVSCRSCCLESNFNAMSLRPCEWKLGNVVSTLHSFMCLYNFDIRVPVLSNKPPEKGMWEVLLSAVSAEAVRLKSAQAVVDGSLVVQDKPLSAERSHEVELFVPLSCGENLEGEYVGKVAGLAILSGSVQAHAYCLPREPLSHAIEDLKGDIIKSLHSRLDILYDAADQVDKGNLQPHTAQSSETVESKPQNSFICWMENDVEHSCQLPHRVFVPWLAGALACDYVQNGECFQDLIDRCKELLGMSMLPDSSDVLEPEAPMNILNQKSFWEATGGYPQTFDMQSKLSKGDGGHKSRLALSDVRKVLGNFIASALIFLSIAVIAALLLKQRLQRTLEGPPTQS